MLQLLSQISKDLKIFMNKLGLEILRENYRKDKCNYKLDLKLGNSELEIFSANNSPKRASYPESCGLRHIALAR